MILLVILRYMNEYLENFSTINRLPFNFVYGGSEIPKKTNQYEPNLFTNEISSVFAGGRWEENEQRLFCKGCLLFGNNWKKVSV